MPIMRLPLPLTQAHLLAGLLACLLGGLLAMVVAGVMLMAGGHA